MKPEAEEREYTGVYVAHWEVPRLVVEVGRRFFGLAARVERWLPVFPEGFELPGGQEGSSMRGPARFCRITVRGRLEPRGRYGHMAGCSRAVFVSEVISCQQIDKRGRTW